MDTKPGPEKKRKKKGRPSLLDLQKRSLRLQQQQEQQQQQHRNPSPNPYLRFPASTPPRRSTRRNPLLADPSPSASAFSSDDDGDGSAGKRREKKLRLVLRLPHQQEKEERNDLGKGTGPPTQGEPSESESGPTTSLPDKKLLVFILDRLQKKDTYGVFSEPVDPNELPDYHDIIEHPMDFGTIRKKLDSGEYANLEQFEEDVFLISSNAMCYNSPDTIYYRQARAIHELAKKNFENLRQESDDNEPEPKKVIRRGRPPSKNTIKRRPPAESAVLDISSNAPVANTGGSTHWTNSNNDLAKKDLTTGMTTRSGIYGLRNAVAFNSGERKAERNEEYLGSTLKGNSKYGKKVAVVVDENRRNTYTPPELSAGMYESPVFSALDGERKLLLPAVGFQTEHAYAKSLARFAANLGPIGWEIAAQKIERSLPPGTKFGRGWVGNAEAPCQSQPPPSTATSSEIPLEPNTSVCTSSFSVDRLPQRQETLPNGLSGYFSKILPPCAAPNGPSDAMGFSETDRGLNNISGLTQATGSGNIIRPKTPVQLHPNPGMPNILNGFNHTFPYDMASQVRMMSRLPKGSLAADAMMHTQDVDMVSRNNNSFMPQASSSLSDTTDTSNVVINSSMVINPSSSFPTPGHDSSSQGSWRSLPSQQKQDSVPRDLNVRFQSSGSPLQQPDLALQL